MLGVSLSQIGVRSPLNTNLRDTVRAFAKQQVSRLKKGTRADYSSKPGNLHHSRQGAASVHQRSLDVRHIKFINSRWPNWYGWKNQDPVSGHSPLRKEISWREFNLSG